jgi:signal transduction histidine kinase
MSESQRLRFRQFAKFISSLHWKLFFTYVLVGILPLFFFFNAVMARLGEPYLEDERLELRRLGSVAATHIALRKDDMYDPAVLFILTADIRQLSESKPNTRILVLDPGGFVLIDTQRAATGGSPRIFINGITERALSGIQHTELLQNGTDFASGTPISVEGETIGAVYIVTSIAHIKETLAGYSATFFNMALTMIVIVIPLVWIASRLLINPLRRIVQSVQKIADGQLSERINVRGMDEYGDLRDAINKTTAQMEKTDANRQEFVSNVSHELRTPLSSIKVLSDALLHDESADVGTFREFLRDISSEVDRMNDIISELLQLVSLEQTEAILNIHPFRLNSRVDNIIKLLRPIAAQRNIQLYLEEVKNVSMDGDEMKIGFIVTNLVENGIKYTPDGGSVTITLDSDHQHAFITVRDTGIGISEQEQPMVFNRFYRVDKTRNRETGGAGLGLSIAHKVILLHNGSVKITSRENEGATFVVRLPLRVGE